LDTASLTATHERSLDPGGWHLQQAVAKGLVTVELAADAPDFALSSAGVFEGDYGDDADRAASVAGFGTQLSGLSRGEEGFVRLRGPPHVGVACYRQAWPCEHVPRAREPRARPASLHAPRARFCHHCAGRSSGGSRPRELLRVSALLRAASTGSGQGHGAGRGAPRPGHVTSRVDQGRRRRGLASALVRESDGRRFASTQASTRDGPAEAARASTKPAFLASGLERPRPRGGTSKPGRKASFADPAATSLSSTPTKRAAASVRTKIVKANCSAWSTSTSHSLGDQQAPVAATAASTRDPPTATSAQPGSAGGTELAQSA
jgi:hypothetical protein